MNTKTDENLGLQEAIKNLTDDQLDELLKEAMRKEGFTKFINYQGEEEEL